MTAFGLWLLKNWKAVAIALILSAFALYWHHSCVKDGEAKSTKAIATYQQAIADYRSAQMTNLRTIEVYKESNWNWASAAKLDIARQAPAVVDLGKRETTRAADLSKSQQKRKVIYAHDQSARTWGDTGIPADVADSLWPEADGGSH